MFRPILFETKTCCLNFAAIIRLRHSIDSYYDAAVIGGGHNGLIAAAYLKKAGLKVGVFERRHLVGGAAVTEEIIPGFEFSRGSYLLSLMRPQIIDELKLKDFGLRLHLRDPSSYTPVLSEHLQSFGGKSLILGQNGDKNKRSIAQFSAKDAVRFEEYEAWLNQIVSCLTPLFDRPPFDFHEYNSSAYFSKQRWTQVKLLIRLFQDLDPIGKEFPSFLELMTAPISKVLCKWFESEPLKATLATDAVIGTVLSPYDPATGYVLLHHVMGECEGVKGAWAYVEGGMGAVSNAIAESARSLGVEIFADAEVSEILVDSKTSSVSGIVLRNGDEIRAKHVLSNATPHVTYLNLLNKSHLSEGFLRDIKSIDYSSSVCKINVAVKSIPNFTANPNSAPNTVMPHHRCTIHLNSEHMDLIHTASTEAKLGLPSSKPMIEMTIPSSLDPTLTASRDSHVVLLFTQFAPYTRSDGPWTQERKDQYADTVFDSIEQYAPGFKASVIGRDILTPVDLESVFGLTGGNIFHGAVTLDQG